MHLCWQTVIRAAAALLGAATTELTPDAHFTDLGGDSLSALTFGNLLREIFDIDVQVGVIVSPANDLAGHRRPTSKPSATAPSGPPSPPCTVATPWRCTPAT